MNKYYYMHYTDDESFGMSYAENEDIFVLPETGEVKSWNIIRFTIKDGFYNDYLPNDLGLRLCSEKLRNIIDENKSIYDNIQWLKAIVKDINGNEFIYYLLHFPIQYDVLDLNKTLFVGNNLIVKAVLNKSKINAHKVFSFPTAGNSRFIISEDIRKNIEVNNCIGINYSKVPLVSN